MSRNFIEGIIRILLVIVIFFWVLPELTKITGLLSVRFYRLLGAILIIVIVLSLVRRWNQ